MTVNPAEVPPVEDVNRGTVVALLALPLGVIAWVIIWSIGIIASIVGFGIAYLTMFLYTRGSGGLISRAGAVRVTIITLVTLGIAIFAGLVSDVAIGISQVTTLSPIEALSDDRFPVVLNTYLADGASEWGFRVVLGIAFGILGCFGILRSAFRATAAPKAMPWPTQPATPEVPEAEQK